MGSSGSAQVSTCDAPGGDLRLQESGLHFTVQQLRALNLHLDTLCEENAARQMSSELENTVENLVQRLVDGAGQKDPRFRCQHIIALHRDKRIRSRSLEYLVTLDALPTLNTGDEECCLQEGPAGYARVKLSGRLADQWQELITPAGYLWRAAVVERWVELVAGCAADARCQQRPAGGAARVLGVPAASAAVPHEYCYLEKSSSSPAASSDYRLAIVEGAVWVHVRVCAASGAEAEAKLALCARGAGGAGNAAHPARLPLAHPLALLHYAAARTGFYATAVGPPSSLSCPERQATWQLWHPALENTLDAHYSERSGVGRLFHVVNAVLDNLRDGRVKPGLRVVSRYAVSCALRRRLELVSGAPTAGARAVLAAHLSHHVLALLDRMVTLCAARRCEAYVYDTACLARGGARSSEAEWRSDAVCLSNYLALLHADTARVEEIPQTPSETLESVLFRRWENILREMRLTTVGGNPQTYSRRQLVYVARVCREVVAYKKTVAQDKHCVFRTNLINATSQNQEPIEDLIHILAIMLDQARDQYLLSHRQIRSGTQSCDLQQEHQSYRSKKLNKLRDFYDVSSACLIDAIRRDPDVRNEDMTDEVNKIKNIIGWLHKGMKDDKKYLGPVLKPFLEALYTSSHENCWFLEDYDAKKLEKEYRGLKRYCLGVHGGSIEPCMGLLDAAKKYAWAKAMVDLVDRSRHAGLKVVFPGADGSGRIACAARLPSRREDESARYLTLTRQDKVDAKRTLATRCVLNAFSAAFTGERAPTAKNPTSNSTDCATTSSNRSEEFLSSMKSGHYWRNTTKPDIVTSNLLELGSADARTSKPRRSRRQRPVTTYGYPDIPINLSQGNASTMRKKYHTLKSLVYSDSVESIRELRERPRSAGSTLKAKRPMSRPTILETLDFINGVRDALCVEESGTSDLEDGGGAPDDESLLRDVSPLNLLARLSRADVPHNTLANIVAALITMGKFTVLQELSCWLGEGRSGALFALHRLARAARSRSHSTDRRSSRLGVEGSGAGGGGPGRAEPAPAHAQRYRLRPPDYFSGDEAPPPPPPPRPNTTTYHHQTRQPRPRYSDYSPPKRLQDLNTTKLDELTKSVPVLNLGPPHISPDRPLALLHEKYTGIINPIYDEKREKFSNKRSKSLGRSFSNRKTVLEATRYNITLGPRSGRQTNDVVTALMETTGETGLDHKGAYFQRFSRSAVVGEGYKVSRVTID